MSHRPCFLYHVTHKESGRRYIGISMRLHARWKKHIAAAAAGSPCYFHRALQKHGTDSFTWEYSMIRSREEAVQEEIKQIAEARLKGVPLYNMTDGGDGAHTLSEEAEHRRLENLRAAFNRPGVRERMSAGILAAHTPAVCAQKSASALEVGQRPEIKARRSETQLERWADPEERAKAGARSRKYWEDPDYRMRVTTAAAITCATPESKAKKNERRCSE